MDRMTEIGKQRHVFIGMVVKMGCHEYDAEDIVQEVLFKVQTRYLDKCYPKGGQIQYMYLYFMLRSAYFDSLKSNKGMVNVASLYEAGSIEDESDVEREEAWERMCECVREQMQALGSYASKLMIVKHGTGISLRQLAKETGISVTSIYNSLKNYGEIIADNCGEDWEDWKNGDFDRL